MQVGKQWPGHPEPEIPVLILLIMSGKSLSFGSRFPRLQNEDTGQHFQFIFTTIIALVVVGATP